MKKGHTVNIAEQVDNIHEGPVVTKRILPDEYVTNNRKYDCRHYNKCLMEVALNKAANTFMCGNCSKYTGAATEKTNVLQFTKTEEVAPIEVYDEATEQTPLFELENPYTLENVNLNDIDDGYKMDINAYSKLKTSMSLLGPLQTVILQKEVTANTPFVQVKEGYWQQKR